MTLIYDPGLPFRAKSNTMYFLHTLESQDATQRSQTEEHIQDNDRATFKNIYYNFCFDIYSFFIVLYIELNLKFGV